MIHVSLRELRQNGRFSGFFAMRQQPGHPHSIRPEVQGAQVNPPAGVSSYFLFPMLDRGWLPLRHRLISIRDYTRHATIDADAFF